MAAPSGHCVGHCVGLWQEHLPAFTHPGQLCFCWFVSRRGAFAWAKWVSISHKGRQGNTLFGSSHTGCIPRRKRLGFKSGQWMRPWMSFPGHCYCCLISSVLCILNIVFTEGWERGALISPWETHGEKTPKEQFPPPPGYLTLGVGGKNSGLRLTIYTSYQA